MTDFFALLREARAQNRPLIWDGAVGTQLIARGLAGQVSEVWNLEKPEVIRAIHEDYFNAGAAVAQTNTFGGARPKLEASGLADRLVEINRRAVEAARAACPPHGLVAADLGPIGKLLPPAGDYPVEAAEAAYAEQARVLADAGVDLFSLETFFDLEEIKAAVRGVRQVSKLPVVASMTFRKTKRGFFTINGVTPGAAAAGLLAAGTDVVGANCSIGPALMAELAAEFRAACAAPIICQANAGDPRVVNGKEVYEQTAEQFAAECGPIRAAGAEIIGACCGSTPEFIRRMAQAWR